MRRACLITALAVNAVDPRGTEFAARRGPLLVDRAADRLADDTRERGAAWDVLARPPHRHEMRGDLDGVLRRRDTPEETLGLAPMEGDPETGATRAAGEAWGAHI